MSDCGWEFEASNQAERRVLIALMAINGVMFVAEFGLGWLSQSTGLIADSLDMLADASVYAISLYAVGRAATAKNTAARLSGWLQISLACLVLIDVARRSVLGSDPQSEWMIGVALVALAANVVCLWLLRKHRDGEVHMRAAWIFSANDVIADRTVGALYEFPIPWDDFDAGPPPSIFYAIDEAYFEFLGEGFPLMPPPF